jgi:hypothetical protein
VRCGSSKAEETRQLNNAEPAAWYSKRETDEDQARSQRLLKMLPDALVFEYGEQRGDLVELEFKPNSHFRPPSHEAALVHAMEGVLWVNGRQKRLVEIS